MITWRARAYKPRESTPQPHTGHHWASREHAGALEGVPPDDRESGRRGPQQDDLRTVTCNPAPNAAACTRKGQRTTVRPGSGRWPLAPAQARARGLRWKPMTRFWGQVMNIAYYHASKFGNGAMVAEEFKKIMAARGVT